jgi:DNA-binding NtrC family response regulator
MKKLLLVDDDIAILKQLSFAFSSSYNVLEAQSREEAFSFIEKNQNIDIALVDLGLPPYENSNREGRLIVSKLLEQTKAKVIVLTGQESMLYSKELISMGVFDYILKPIEISSLMLSLKRASFFIDNEDSDEDLVSLSFKASLEDGLKGSSDEAQKQLLIKILNKTNFNINQTAKILAISRENCYYFLKKFNIKRPNV